MDFRQEAEAARALAASMRKDYAALAASVETLAHALADDNAFVADELCDEVQQALAAVKEQRARVRAVAAGAHAPQEPQDFAALGGMTQWMEAAAAAQEQAEAARWFLQLETERDDVRAELAQVQEALRALLAQDGAPAEEALRPYLDFAEAWRAQGSERSLKMMQLAATGRFSIGLLGDAFAGGTMHVADAPEDGTDEPDAPADLGTPPAPEEPDGMPGEPAPLPVTSAEDEALWAKLQAAGTLLPASFDYGELTVQPLTPKSQAKESAKAFLSDWRKMVKDVRMCAGALLSVLPAVDYLCEDTLLRWRQHRWKSGDYEAVKYQLIHMGYLREFQLAGCGAFCVATPKLKHALSLEKVCNRLGLEVQPEDDGGEPIADKASYAAARLAMSRLHVRCQETMGYPKSTDARRRIYNAFAAMAMGLNDGKNRRHLMLFWFAGEQHDGEEAAAFRDAFAELVVEGKTLDFTIAGMQREQLDHLVAFVHDAFPALREVPTYFYLLPENQMYDAAWTPAPDWFAADGAGEADDAEDAEDDDEEPVPEPGPAAGIPGDGTEDGASTGASAGEEAEEPAEGALTTDAAPVPEPAEHEAGAPPAEALTEEAADAPAEGAPTAQEPDAPPAEPPTAQEADAPAAELPAEQETVAPAGHAADAGGRAPAEEASGAAPAGTSGREAADDDVMQDVVTFLCAGRDDCAAAYLGYCSHLDEAWEEARLRLSYALDDPAVHPVHASSKLMEVYEGAQSVLDEYLLAAAALRAFFSNDLPHDYMMDTFFRDIVKRNLGEEGCQSAKNLIHKLKSFKETYEKGADFYAAYRYPRQQQREQQLASLRKEAELDYHKNVLHPTQNRLNLHVYHTMLDVYGKNDDLAMSLAAVMEDDTAQAEGVSEFLTTFFCDDKAAPGEWNIDPEKLKEYINAAWDRTSSKVDKKTERIKGALGQGLLSDLTKSTDILRRWLELTAADTIAPQEDRDAALEALRKQVHEALDEADAALAAEGDPVLEAGLRVLRRALAEIAFRMDGAPEASRPRMFYDGFLSATELLLDQDYLPDFRAFWHIRAPRQKYLAALRAYAAAERPADAAAALSARLDALLDPRSEAADDYQTLGLIDARLQILTGTSPLAKERHIIEEDSRRAGEGLDEAFEKFKNYLEYKQCCGALEDAVGDVDERGDGEIKKEDYLRLAEDCRSYAEATRNYGAFRRADAAFRREIEQAATAHGERLQEEVERLRAGDLDERHAKFLLSIQDAIDDQNYTVAQDDLRRWAEGDIDTGGIELPKGEADHLANYLREYEDNYTVINNSRSFKRLLESRSGKGSPKVERGRQEIKENWLKNPMDGERMKNLLHALGWDVASVEELDVESEEDRLAVTGRTKFAFNVKLKDPLNHSKSRYIHPIAAFGSQAQGGDNSFRVVCLFGEYKDEGLVNTVAKIGGASKPTIVFLDYALKIATLRRYARKIKKACLNTTFAIIDRVVTYYLFRHYDETDVNRRLMMLIMPFCYYQPYVPDAVNSMPPEMFMGRKKELADIEDPKGPNIIYGGRQLGKSAILRMAANDINYQKVDRNTVNRAIVVNIQDQDTEGAAERVCKKLNEEHFFKTAFEVRDWQQLVDRISARLREPTNRIYYFLLMLDEADIFIEHCKDEGYKPLNALKELQGDENVHFKFVIAGLHDIVRFYRDDALRSNSGLAHLSSITVKPFHVGEARELLEWPLYYLGIRFAQRPGGRTKKNPENYIALILAQANYFPGLIQLYCKKLVDTLCGESLDYYGEGKAPIYYVEEQHIMDVLGDEEFKWEVRNKFRITLGLDNDNYYMIIALLLAFLYYNEGIRGYRPDELRATAEAYNVVQIRALTVQKLQAFMDELCDLNVLRKGADGSYVFSRQSFFHLMGRKNVVENELEDYME